MNKIVVILSIVLVVVVTSQSATLAATYSMKELKHNAHSTSRERGAISVFTYLVGGPRGKSKRRRPPASDVVVRVRRTGDGKALVGEARSLRNGRAIFRVSVGVYQIEGAIESPESTITVRRPCGSRIVRVHRNRQVPVRLYCSVP